MKKHKLSRLELKLSKYLKTQGYELQSGTLVRTYSGHWQRSCGAWLWWAYANIKIKSSVNTDKVVRSILDWTQITIGSQYPLTDLMKKDTELVLSGEGLDVHIDPK